MKKKPLADATAMNNGLEKRLKSVLRGAFSGPPTPLKDIPKESGESRAQRKQPMKKKKPSK